MGRRGIKILFASKYFLCFLIDKVLDFIKLLLIAVYQHKLLEQATSLPVFSLLPWERTLVAASHVAPKIWVCLKGGVVRIKLCLMWGRHKIHWRACKLMRIDLKYVSHQNKFISKVSPLHTRCFRPENDFGGCWLMDLLFDVHFLN